MVALFFRTVAAGALLGLLVGTAPAVVADTPVVAPPVAERAQALYQADRLEEALALLETRLAEVPTDRAARLTLAEITRKRCDLDGVLEHTATLLAQRPGDPGARAEMADVFLLRGQAQVALGHAEKALAGPGGQASALAWRAHALVLVDLGRYAEARRSAARASQLAPGNHRMWEAVARAAFRGGDMAASRAAYQRVLQLDPDHEEANLRLGSGFGAGGGREGWRGREGAAFRQAVSAWHRRDLADASARFLQLAAGDPREIKYRLGLGLVRREMRESQEVRFGRITRDAYLLQPAPAAEGIERFITNWSSLPPWAKRAVLISVAPGRRWLPALRRRGATHQILRLSDTITDAPSRRALRGKKTFDGRLYAHLRGVGGREAATGIEKLAAATGLAFNTFAHEYAHQLLRHAFPQRLLSEVQRLYRRARDEGRTLDYYAASNVDEYFAQGYEALVSHVKRGCQRDTARHTRQELRERDPALYAFLLRHLDLSHEQGNALDRFRASLPR